MGKKNMDALLSNIMGEAIIRVTDKPEAPQPMPNTNEKKKQKETVTEEPWKHFSFICSVELADKVQAIARKEGFSIRALMEFMMRQGIAMYEAKNGKVKKLRNKTVSEVM